MFTYTINTDLKHYSSGELTYRKF